MKHSTNRVRICLSRALDGVCILALLIILGCAVLNAFRYSANVIYQFGSVDPIRFWVVSDTLGISFMARKGGLVPHSPSDNGIDVGWGPRYQPSGDIYRVTWWPTFEPDNKGTSVVRVYFDLVIPLWILLLVFLIKPTWSFMRWRSRRHLRLSGHCDRCGYNLHGITSKLCPECGVVIDHDKVPHRVP